MFPGHVPDTPLSPGFYPAKAIWEPPYSLPERERDHQSPPGWTLLKGLKQRFLATSSDKVIQSQEIHWEDGSLFLSPVSWSEMFTFKKIILFKCTFDEFWQMLSGVCDPYHHTPLSFCRVAVNENTFNPAVILWAARIWCAFRIL